MIDFTIDTQIERRPEEVFDYVTDPGKLDTWQTNTVSAVREDAGPMRVGSRLREVHKAPGGKELPSLVEVTEFDRPRAFGLKVVEGSLPVDLDIGLEPGGGGTLMRFRGHGQLDRRDAAGPAAAAAGAQAPVREAVRHAEAGAGRLRVTCPLRWT